MTKYQVKQARTMLGMTQEKFSAEIGIKSRMLRRLESGDSDCSKSSAVAIECVLRRAKLWNAWSKQNG